MAEGTIDDGLEQIEFKACSMDSLLRGRQRLLWQFSNSSVMDQILQCLSSEVQELIDASCELLKLRTLYDAEGIYLDEAGDIIGEKRLGRHDIEYKEAIIAKIYKNHTRYGSVPEVRAYYKKSLDKDISIFRVAPLDVEFVVPEDTTDEEILEMTGTIDNTKVSDSMYTAPIMATARIVGVRRQSTKDLFRPDNKNGRADSSYISALGAKV